MQTATEPARAKSSADPGRADLTRWLGAAVMLVAMLAFTPVISHGFLLWDDGALVFEDPAINPPIPAHWAHYWTAPSRLYMPLTHTAWGLFAMAAHNGTSGPSALNAAVYHAASLLLHGINALLVFLLLRRIVRTTWPAFMGALLFAVHPLQTETVAWISETSILLSSAFSLLALLEFSRFADARFGPAPPIGSASADAVSPQPIGTASADAVGPPSFHGLPWLHYALGTFALALALFSKPSAVVVPALAFLIEGVLRKRPWGALALPLVIWLAMSLPIAYVTHLWQTTTVIVPLWQRPIVAADALAFYLYKFFVPLNLLPMYGRTPQWLFSHGPAALTWIAPALLLILAIVLWRRARWVAVGAMLFAAALLPVLGLNVFVFQHISTTADRYVYLSMLGPALIVACALTLAPTRAAMGMAGVILAVLMILSLRQAGYWSDTLTLFTHVIETHPDSRPAQDLVALAYNVQARESSGDNPRAARELLQKACDHYRITATLPGDDGISYFNAGDCLVRLHKPREAIDSLNAALQDPKFELRANAYDLMGACYQILKDNAKAADCYTRAAGESLGPEQTILHQAAMHHLQSLRLFEAIPSATRPAPKLNP